jgi:hypothetical protein
MTKWNILKHSLLRTYKSDFSQIVHLYISKRMIQVHMSLLVSTPQRVR